MQKFECIMNQSELNYKRYRKLISAYQRKASDLVCFVGAGLSLYSKAWGEPFTRIVEDLKCKLDDRHTYYCRRENQISSSIHPDKQEHQRTIAEIIDKLKNAITQIKDIDETYVKQKLFMEAGDEINKILECLCKPQNIITGNNGDNKYENFNRLCRHVLSDIIKEKKEKSNTAERCDGQNENTLSPYGTQAAYFLPYFSLCGIRIITTNFDTSFADACARNCIDFDEDKEIIPSIEKDALDRWRKSPNAVFYIHGHIKNDQTMVLTKNKYEEVYPTIGSGDTLPQGAWTILHDIASSHSVLFMGTSLDKDYTVKIINQYTPKNANNERPEEYSRLAYIPFFKFANAYGNFPEHGLDLPEPIGFCEHDDYPTTIHMFLREIDNGNLFEGCEWKQEYNVSNNTRDDVDQSAKVKIQESLDCDDSFQLIKLSKINYDNYESLLQYISQKYLMPGGGQWTLCVIREETFKFKGEDRSVLNNLPLGNTIYFFKPDDMRKCKYSPSMSNAAANDISDEIESWITETYSNYKDASPLGEDLKVRVIIPDLMLSAQEQAKMPYLVWELSILIDRLATAAPADIPAILNNHREVVEYARANNIDLSQLCDSNLNNAALQELETLREQLLKKCLGLTVGSRDDVLQIVKQLFEIMMRAGDNNDPPLVNDKGYGYGKILRRTKGFEQ